MEAIETIERFIAYLRAVVKHYFLMISGALLTLVLPWIKSEILSDPKKLSLLQSLIDKYSLWIGLALIFVATFRAWNEEHEKAHANADIDGLRQQVAELQAQVGRHITAEQRRLFEIACKRMDTSAISLSPVIFHRTISTEALNYALELVELFRSNKIEIGVPAGTDLPQFDNLGLAPVVGNPDSPPPGGHKLMALFQASGITCHWARDSRYELSPNEAARNFYWLYVGKDMSR